MFKRIFVDVLASFILLILFPLTVSATGPPGAGLAYVILLPVMLILFFVALPIMILLVVPFIEKKKQEFIALKSSPWKKYFILLIVVNIPILIMIFIELIHILNFLFFKSFYLSLPFNDELDEFPASVLAFLLIVFILLIYLLIYFIRRYLFKKTDVSFFNTHFFAGFVVTAVFFSIFSMLVDIFFLRNL